MDPELQKFLALANKNKPVDEKVKSSAAYIAPDDPLGTVKATTQGLARGATLDSLPGLFGLQTKIMEFMHGPNDERTKASREVSENLPDTLRANEKNYPSATKWSKAGGTVIPAVPAAIGVGALAPALGASTLGSMIMNGMVTGGGMSALETANRDVSGLEDASLGDYVKNTAIGAGTGGAGGAFGKLIGRAIDPVKDIIASLSAKLAPAEKAALTETLQRSKEVGMRPGSSNPSAGQALEATGLLTQNPNTTGLGREVTQKTIKLADRAGKRPTVDEWQQAALRANEEGAEQAAKGLLDIGPFDDLWTKGSAKGVHNLGVKGHERLTGTNKLMPGSGDSPEAFQITKSILEGDLEGLTPALTPTGKVPKAVAGERADIEKGITRMDELTDRTLPKGWREAPKFERNLETTDAFRQPLERPLPREPRPPPPPRPASAGSLALSSIGGGLKTMAAATGIPLAARAASSVGRNFANRGVEDAVGLLMKDPATAAAMFGSAPSAGKQVLPSFLTKEMLEELGPLLWNTPAMKQWRD